MILWKLGGAVCNQPDVLDRLAAAYAPGWIVMHGAGPQLDAALREVDGAPRKVAGLRVTSTAGAEVVRRTLDGVGAELVRLLRERGVPATHVPASDGWMSGIPKTVPEGELGRVGIPHGIDAARIQAVIDAGEVPVVTPVAYDQAGPLNINADEAAAATAAALKVQALHLVTDVPHVRAGDEPVLQLDPKGAQALIRDGHAEGGMIPKLLAAIAASNGGVPQVRIGDLSSILSGNGTVLAEVLPSTGTA